MHQKNDKFVKDYFMYNIIQKIYDLNNLDDKNLLVIIKKTFIILRMWNFQKN